MSGAAGGGWLSDIAAGAVSSGVNLPTFVALNAALLAVILCLILLLAFSLSSPGHAFLVPHVAVLIFLAIGLWGLMIWLIGVVGLTDVSSSDAAAAAGGDSDEGSDEGGGEAADGRRKQE